MQRLADQTDIMLLTTLKEQDPTYCLSTSQIQKLKKRLETSKRTVIFIFLKIL